MRIFREIPILTERDLARLWAKFERLGPDECWHWRKPGKRGYGMFRIGDSNYLAHRVVYSVLVGPPPVDLTLDHTCHNESDCDLAEECPHRACVNPSHLDPVTDRVNILRGKTIPAAHALVTHCPEGHEYTPENTSIRKTGERGCRACHRASGSARYERDGEDIRAKNREAWKSVTEEQRERKRESERAWRARNRDANLARRRERYRMQKVAS